MLPERKVSALQQPADPEPPDGSGCRGPETTCPGFGLKIGTSRPGTAAGRCGGCGRCGMPGRLRTRLWRRRRRWCPGLSARRCGAGGAAAAEERLGRSAEAAHGCCAVGGRNGPDAKGGRSGEVGRGGDRLRRLGFRRSAARSSTAGFGAGADSARPSRMRLARLR